MHARAVTCTCRLCFRACCAPSPPPLGTLPLQVTQDTDGGTVLTDTSGRQAKVVGGPAPLVLADCDAAVYVVDSVRARAGCVQHTAWRGGGGISPGVGGWGVCMAAVPRLCRLPVACVPRLLQCCAVPRCLRAGAHACRPAAPAAAHHRGPGPGHAGRGGGRQRCAGAGVTRLPAAHEVRALRRAARSVAPAGMRTCTLARLCTHARLLFSFSGVLRWLTPGQIP